MLHRGWYFCPPRLTGRYTCGGEGRRMSTTISRVLVKFLVEVNESAARSGMNRARGIRDAVLANSGISLNCFAIFSLCFRFSVSHFEFDEWVARVKKKFISPRNWSIETCPSDSPFRSSNLISKGDKCDSLNRSFPRTSPLLPPWKSNYHPHRDNGTLFPFSFVIRIVRRI